MARRALIEVLGDAESYLKSLRASAAGSRQFEGELKGLAVAARTSADAQVSASVHKTQRLRQEVTAYHEIAAAASRGSREQIAAANLAARAEGQLARSLGVTAHEQRTLAASASTAERNLGRATRGALAGSGVFRSFGRSLAFASGGFLLFASAGDFVRKSVDAAKEAQVTQRQLSQQFRNDKLVFADYRGEVDKTGLRISALSGYTKDDLDVALTTILRTTPNVAKALRDEGTAADLARARHIGLSQAALIVAKTEAGNTTLLRRQGFQIAKNATAEEALAFVRAKVAGQARAGATEQQRFGAILHDSEVIIGTGLLPTLNRYLADGAVWLTQMNESGRLQRDVEHISRDLTRVLHDAGDVARFVAAGFHDLNRATGSAENTLKTFAAVWLVLKARMVVNWLAAAAGIEAVGGRAVVATGRLSALRSVLLSLNGLAVTATVLVLERRQAARALFHIPGAEDFAKAIDDRIPFLKRLDQNAGLYPGQLDPGRYARPDHVSFPKARQAPPGYQPGTYGRALSTPENPGGFLPVDRTRPGTAAAARAPKPLSPAGRFNLDEFRLADAQRAQNTTLQRAILADEEAIVLKLRDQAKTLKDRTKYAQQAAGIEDSIRSIDQQAAAAAKQRQDAARKRAADARKARESFTVPVGLQVAQARADAAAALAGSTDMTKGQRQIAIEIRNAALRAIHAHRLVGQGLIDAWNTVTTETQQLASKTAGDKWATNYHTVAARALTAGLNLPREQELLIQERAAQRQAHRGHAPSGPAAQGQVVYDLRGSQFHGIRNVDDLMKQIERKTRVRAAQR